MIKYDVTEQTENLDKIKFTKLKKCVENLERDFSETPNVLENMDISFEYLMASFFPSILNNIKREMVNQFIAGLEAGRKDLIDETTEKIVLSNPDNIKIAINYLELGISNLFNEIRNCSTKESKDELTKVIGYIKEIISLCNNLIREEI